MNNRIPRRSPNVGPLQFKLLRIGIAAALIALSLWYVWPTPYNSYTLHDPIRLVRVNRFTGSTEVLSPYGWFSPAERRSARLRAEYKAYSDSLADPVAYYQKKYGRATAMDSTEPKPYKP